MFGFNETKLATLAYSPNLIIFIHEVNSGQNLWFLSQTAELRGQSRQTYTKKNIWTLCYNVENVKMSV